MVSVYVIKNKIALNSKWLDFIISQVLIDLVEFEHPEGHATEDLCWELMWVPVWVPIWVSDYSLKENKNSQLSIQKTWDPGIQSHQISSVAQSCPTLWPHKPKPARPPYPSPIPGVHSNSRPLSQWCHSAISSCFPFSSCLQSFPASESFFRWVSSLHQVARVLEFQH